MILRMRVLALFAALAVLWLNPAQAQRTHAEHHRLQYLANRMLVEPAATVPELRANNTPPARAMLAYLMATGVIPGGPDEARMILDGAVWDAIAAVPPDGRIRSYERPSRRRSQINAVAIWAQEDLGDQVATMLRRTLLVFRAYEARPFVDREGDADNHFSGYRPTRYYPTRFLLLTLPCRGLSHRPDSAVRAFWPDPARMAAYVIGAPFDCPIALGSHDSLVRSILENPGNSGYDLRQCAFRGFVQEDQTPGDINHPTDVYRFALAVASRFPSALRGSLPDWALEWDPLNLAEVMQHGEWAYDGLVRTDVIARGRRLVAALTPHFQANGLGERSALAARAIVAQLIPRPCNDEPARPMSLADRFGFHQSLATDAELIASIPRLTNAEARAAWERIGRPGLGLSRPAVRDALLRTFPALPIVPPGLDNISMQWSCSSPPSQRLARELLLATSTVASRRQLLRSVMICDSPAVLAALVTAGGLVANADPNGDSDQRPVDLDVLDIAARRAAGLNADGYPDDRIVPTTQRAGWQWYAGELHARVRVSHPGLPPRRYLTSDWIAQNPVQAIQILRSGTSMSARMWLALTLYSTQPENERRNREIHDALVALQQQLESIPTGIVGSDLVFVGENGPLTEYFVAYWLNRDVPNELGISVIGSMPCTFLDMRPELANAFEARFGSSMDGHLPASTCETPWERTSTPRLIAYWNQVRRYAVDYYEGGGTIQSAYHRAAYVALVRAQIGSVAEESRQYSLEAFPLASWATIGRWNWSEFVRLRSMFIEARRELATVYQLRGRMNAAQSEQMAHDALCAMYERWAPCGGMRPSLEHAILSGAPINEIAGYISLFPALPPLGVGPGDRDQVHDDGRNFTGTPEPLLMLAATRPSIVGLLVRVGYDVNAVNDFGRSVLMTMAQYNDIESARLVIEAGASVNAQSAFHGGWLSGTPLHGSRTALMYAAANGSLAMIRHLLIRGADPMMIDSRGLRAAHYLNGEGPVPRNPRLSPAEFAEAMRLLD